MGPSSRPPAGGQGCGNLQVTLPFLGLEDPRHVALLTSMATRHTHTPLPCLLITPLTCPNLILPLCALRGRGRRRGREANQY